MGKNLFNKIWDAHKVKSLKTGQDQLFIGLHLIHEVTSPQAFQMLSDRNLSVLFPERTVATVDHIVPTDSQSRPLTDPLAEEMLQVLENNVKKHGIRYFGLGSENQGIVHIIGPELGLTQPGMTIACGDSHTSTHGALGAIAFGIGTSQIRDVLATQTLAISRPKVKRILANGQLGKGIYSKDLILDIIRRLGVMGGIGFTYEYAGVAIEALDIEARLTVCNMSIEGGARAGYINPDGKTFDYLKNREFAPKNGDFTAAVDIWKQFASDKDADYDDQVEMNADDLEPIIAWGINPGQAVGISEKLPKVTEAEPEDRENLIKAYGHTEFEEGQPLTGTKIDVAFIGSCTNGRISDLREAAGIAKGKKVAAGVKALVVPGSRHVKRQAENEGIDAVFTEAGFEWRDAGCSMCLAMNPDKLNGAQICATSSNRNFIGRQGSPTGRSLLMSPAMVAAAAITGEITDVRKFIYA
jgi:3-isopropylmalate/(R)-2-methylmalate dehydratase large subunit